MPDAIQRLKAYLKQSFDALPDTLSGLTNLDYSVDRFGLAYRTTGRLEPAEIVLLRQAVRWSGFIGRNGIPVGYSLEQQVSYTEKTNQWIRNAGVKWTTNGFLSAEPYSPGWLSEKVDMDENPQPRALNEKFAGEPYLQQKLDFKKWMSPAQKEAVWTVLNLPEGSTCIIVLPTGCGKSSCFWLLPTFTDGLTVVVVPTVALAMDQEQNASDRLKNVPGVNPCFFASDDNPEVTIDMIKEKKSRLVFASPETCVAGRLRPILNEFAHEGWFKNLVVDEAHIIETWGAEFRVEFQILSSTRKEWLKKSKKKLRTFLFSATMSPGCRESLREMFSEENHVQELICQRLRPEMKYFSKQFNDNEERWPKLLEAIWRLPRPAILYVTRPSGTNTDQRQLYADRLFGRLRDEEEFQRIGCFTGETKQNERRKLLKDWKNDKIDLMVATSAFGLGVDKADVRTVIHACYPENLDRYYQEVGRSGRDGYSSICLLMPTIEDRTTARKLGVKLMKEKSVQARWEALYRKSRRLEEGNRHTFELPIEAKRMELIGTRTYSENVKWNKRLLMQLQRAKLIELLALVLEKPEDPNEDRQIWCKVKVKFAPGMSQLGEKISSQRDQEIKHLHEGFEQLKELFSPNRCVSTIFRKLYDVPSDQKVCGGCYYCRLKKRTPTMCPPLRVTEGETDSDFLLCRTIIAGCPDPTEQSSQDDFVEFIEKCLFKYSIEPLHLYCLNDHYNEIMKLLKGVLSCYQKLYRIDPFVNNTVVKPLKDRSILFLHIGQYSEEMLKKAKCNKIYHLFCSGINELEPNGRLIRIRYKSDYYRSSKAWLSQLT